MHKKILHLRSLRKKLIIGIMLGIITLSIPLTIYLNRQQTNTQSQAADACPVPPAPTNLQPFGTLLPGIQTLTWENATAAAFFKVHVNDLSDGFSTSCSTITPNDACNNNVANNSFDFSFQDGHSYEWSVSYINSCGSESQRSKANVIATSTGIVPSVDSAQIGPSIITIAGNSSPLSISAFGTGEAMRIYIHGTAFPTSPFPILGLNTYDPQNVNDVTFYYLGDDSVSIVPPTTQGQYYVTFAGVSGKLVCLYDGKLYREDAPGSLVYTGSACTNTTRYTKAIAAYYPSVSGLSVASNKGPGDTNTISVSSIRATKHWLYLHKDNTPTASPSATNTVVETYDPTNIDPDTFYRVGVVTGSTGSMNFQNPAEPGRYFITSSAHADSAVTIPWNQYDRSCNWNNRIYKYASSGPISVGDTCTNPGLISFSVIGDPISPTPTPTNTPTPTRSPTPTASLTPTPVPAMGISLTIFYHGIGSSGDNPNPNTSTLSNKNPQTKERVVEISILDENDTVVLTKSGSVTYNEAAGNFTGVIDLGNTLSTDRYFIRVRSDKYLRRRITGTHLLTNGTTAAIPQATLVAGDADIDNNLTILDYNMLLGCYSDFSPPIACDALRKFRTDFNDDGFVNQHDYNLFIRELSVQYGD